MDCLLLTGSTGYLGKAVLEKLLRSCQSVQKIYLVIRTGKHSVQEKVIKLFHSSVFQLLQTNKPKFVSLLCEKVVIIQSDISKKIFEIEEVYTLDSDGSGNIKCKKTQISLKDIQSNLQTIIHTAATINFDERLDFAVRTNVFGTLSLLQFAKTCPKFQCFCHISTAYVNCFLKGRISETINYPKAFPDNESPLQFCERVLLQQEPEISNTTTQYLQHFGFPNTYTFTKWMTEVILEQHRETIPLIFLRPAIIGCALMEPAKGWVDAATAASAVFLMVGLGILQTVPSKLNLVCEQVPVDFVVKSILLSIFAKLQDDSNQISIYHVATGAINPCSWSNSITPVTSFFRKYTPRRAIAKPVFWPSQSNFHYYAHYYWKYYKWLLLNEGNRIVGRRKEHAENKKQIKFLMQKETKLVQTFYPFINGEWVFEMDNLLKLQKQSAMAQTTDFLFHFGFIHWENYFTSYARGIYTYILKEPLLDPQLASKI